VAATNFKPKEHLLFLGHKKNTKQQVAVLDFYYYFGSALGLYQNQ